MRTCTLKSLILSSPSFIYRQDGTNELSDSLLLAYSV